MIILIINLFSFPHDNRVRLIERFGVSRAKFESETEGERENNEWQTYNFGLSILLVMLKEFCLLLQADSEKQHSRYPLYCIHVQFPIN